MNKLLWALPLLILSVLCISAGASAFNLLEGVSGAMKAAWRLEIAAYVLLIVQVYDWVTQRDACCRMWHQEWKLVITCGVLSGSFFVLFANSLQLTTMAHCLVLLDCTPVALLLYSLAIGKPLYKWEAVGVVVSLVGMLLVVLDISSGDGQASWQGDFMAFMAMLITAAYMVISKELLAVRKCPVFAFFAPGNVIGSLTAYLIAWCLGEGGDYFGWTSSDNIAPALFMGLVAGVLGMSLISYLQVYISVLLITIFINLEPLIGSFIGWTLGLQGNPSLQLCLGGLITIAGNTAVALYGSDSHEEAMALQQADKEESELTRSFR
jgi:drug/metabolite transporter (DMT)-like permease